MNLPVNIETIHDDTIKLNLKHNSYPEQEHYFKQLFHLHKDILIIEKHFPLKGLLKQFTFIYADTMVTQRSINEIALPAITSMLRQLETFSIQQLEHALPIGWTYIGSLQRPITLHRLSSLLFEGNIIFYSYELAAIFSIMMPSTPTRTTSEAAAETSIRGSRDGLVEDISQNVALLRKRIRSIHFVCHTFSIGTLTNTKVAVMYLDNKLSEQVKQQLFDRINRIDVESLLTIGEMEQLISDKQRLFSFPSVDHSGRPDYIAKNILEGRFVVLVDNNPIALMGPCNLTNLLRSPEDSYFPVAATNVGILIRALGLLVTVFLPAFYVAITMYHPDQLPLQLLSTISVSRSGLPVDPALEMFLILLLMESFREATFRMPSAIAQTVTVVGGLIIGEASIRAELVSPIIVVVAALTVIGSSTLVNQSITSTTVLLRFLSLFISAVLGIFGFIFSFMILLISLTRVRSFGVPYLLILTPMYWDRLGQTFFMFPMSWRKTHRSRAAQRDKQTKKKKGES